MKTYIFVIRRITYITGAVQYVYNKSNYLESKGWRVLIFSAIHGPLYVENLKKHSENIYPQLYLTPHCFRRNDVYNVVDSIIAKVGDCNQDTCIIESDALQRAVWAELVAQRLRCRHLAFFVRESHYFYDEAALKFLRFKYDRHELAGIKRESIRQILYDKDVEKREDTYFAAYCNNVIEDVEDNYSSMLNDKADYSIGYLGRLEKPCVLPIVEGICSYVLRYPNKMFNLVMIGGSTKRERVSYIRKRFASFSNVKLVMTGNMYPIPMSFVKKIDVFVSTAGSATATYKMSIPTIKVNPLNGEPVGIIGLDFMPGEKSMYDSYPDSKIEDYIEKALTQKAQIVFPSNIDEYFKRMNKEYERQLSFIHVDEPNTYYDEKKLLKIKTGKKYWRSYWIIGHLFGARGIQFYWRIRHNPKDFLDNVSSVSIV